MKGKNNVPTIEQIQSALYINGDEDLLLERISKGNTVALLQLVMLQMPDILSCLQRFELTGSHTENIDAITNAAIKEIKNLTGKLSRGNLKRNWQDEIHDAVNKAAKEIKWKNLKGEKKINKDFKVYSTPKAKSFLNNINNKLTTLQQEILKRGRDYRQIGKQNILKKNFTTDFELNVEIIYFLKNSDYESHRYETSCPKFKHREEHIFLDTAINDWHEEGGYWPKLNKPYCYLMHDLLYHSRLNEKIFDLNCIWVDFKFIDQRIMDVFKNGKTRVSSLQSDLKASL